MKLWREIEDFEGYWVSDQGEVYSQKTKKVLKPRENGRGYLKVALCRNGKPYQAYVHRLVAQAFVANPENKEQIDHINAVRTDNRAENLRWCSAKENHDYKSDESKEKCLMNIPGPKTIIERINDETTIAYPSLSSVPGISFKSLSNHVRKGKVEFVCKGRTFICPDNMLQ